MSRRSTAIRAIRVFPRHPRYAVEFLSLTIEPGDAVTTAVRILRLAGGGDGVGKLGDGRTVFVPRTAPGDLVELQALQLHDRFARARPLAVLEPGPARVSPACPHYDQDECGGCQLQHLALGEQLTAKRSFVGDAVRRIGKLPVEDPEIVPSEVAWEYRTKVTLAVAAGGRRIGYHRYDRPGELFDLDRCLIAAPPLMRLWSAVSAERNLLAPGARHLVLRLDRSGGRHLIVKVSGTEVWSEARRFHTALEARGEAATIWWLPEAGAPRVVAGGSDAYPATVFEQVHPALGDRIRAYAVEQLGELPGRHVWDLYAGIGETTRVLLAAEAAVESVEVDRRAVEVGGQADGRTDGPMRRGTVRRLIGKAENLVRSMAKPDLVITNPPRAGMDRLVVDAIRAASPNRLVYISCDPATLARDLGRLTQPSVGPPARLSRLLAFDLFPQTAHVETVAVVEAA